ncbi:MAG TPA: MBL fold metallo-hydrolase [Candidatus Dormibacteraeota bacterium]|nr:MBL fold metallo-hydrolase [Candidatus Dormibacteraeota bacterium]
MIKSERSSIKLARAELRRAFTLAIAAALVLSMFAARVVAQQRPAGRPAVTKKGDEILLLGTHGGPGLTRERSEPSSLLIVDGRPYLIDCGIGTMRRLLDAGVPSQTIGTIFITHDHPDHALGLVDVLANDFLSLDFGPRGARRTFNIYGPPQTPALVSAAYDYIRIPYSIFAAEHLGVSTLVDPFKAHVIDRHGLVYQDDKIRVTATENTHYQLMAAKYRARMKSFAYRFETPYGAIVFTGDTGPSAAVEKLATGADVLISEVISVAGVPEGRGAAPNQSALAAHMRMEHLPTKDLGEMATRAQVKAVLMHHFVGAGSGQQFVEGVKKYYSGPVFAGADLQRYCLGTPDGNGGAVRTLAECK